MKNDLAKSSINIIRGDIYYRKSDNRFYKVTKVEGDKIHLVSCDKKKAEDVTEKAYISEYFIKLHLLKDENFEDSLKSLHDEMIKRFINPSKNGEEEEDENLSTEIVSVDRKKHYEEIAHSLERTRNRIEIIENMAKARIRQFSKMRDSIETRLNNVIKVIGMLETYLVVREEIVQIREGVPAPVDEKICIRQLILYMDEEAGLVDIYRNRETFGAIRFDGFINFENIHKFDEWLLEDNHLDIVLPEKKGIVALRPSRQDHYALESFWSKLQKEALDKEVYLLIRNGDCVYRVCTGMHMSKILFPTVRESEYIAKVLSGENKSGSYFQEYEKDAKNAQENWVKNTLLLQGLLDRGLIFNLNERIDLMNPATYEENGGMIRMIRDGEMVLADGRERFPHWRENLNRDIKRGNRIYFPGLFENYSRRDLGKRFPNYYSYAGTYPNVPEPGIYTIDDIIGERYGGDYCFYYLPDDTVWKRSDEYRGCFDEANRKKRYLFSVYSDEFVNYDDFDIESLDYFLSSRIERGDYLKLIPTLVGLRNARAKELEQEKAFVNLLSQKHDIPEDKLWELVDWWKKKVINKRPLNQDDAKAWRMIIRKAGGIDKKRKK